ncbi:MAG: hypothetical protein CL479_08080 [Acidobacteria bacterium]|nr:hypothetical protein [Acidobacteriota bacterium]|tara:strand:+ start:262 stop:675 length:414 start_codon:yes stop_codon:yes gene_type:complete
MRKRQIDYAVKKRVRNQVIREVDPIRQREFRQSLGVGILLVAVILFAAWQHHELRQHGYQMVEIEVELIKVQEENQRRRLEVEGLQTLERIYTIATEELGLEVPTAQAVVHIERITPAQPAGDTVVARGNAMGQRDN